MKPRQPDAARGRLAQAAVLAASIASTTAVHAQGDTCEQFRDKLAARMEAGGMRGFSLEIVPAAAPVPPGAKVVGSCGGGVRSVLLRRGSAAAPSAAASAAPVPAPARPASSTAAPAPKVAPTAAPVPPPATRSAASTTPEPSAAPRAHSLPAAAASVAVTATTPDLRSEQRDAGPASADAPAASPWAFAVRHRAWLLALLVLSLTGAAWLWRKYLSPYDSAGLPRGPRL
jgi:hypothetical protein